MKWKKGKLKITIFSNRKIIDRPFVIIYYHCSIYRHPSIFFSAATTKIYYMERNMQKSFQKYTERGKITRKVLHKIATTMTMIKYTVIIVIIVIISTMPATTNKHHKQITFCDQFRCIGFLTASYDIERIHSD